MWSAGSERLARNASRAHREIDTKHRQWCMSETDASSSSRSTGLRSLLPSCSSSSSTGAAQDTHSAVITSNSAAIGAVKSASAAAATHAGTGLHRQHTTHGQHSTPSGLFGTAAARVRSLAAAFEMSRTTSINSQPSSPSGSIHSGDLTDSEADVAVLIAHRCVKQLTETWETYSAGGSAANSECSTPTALFSHHQPSSRPVTPAAAPANTYSADAAATPSLPYISAAGTAASKATADPAAAVLQCWRQESGQFGSIIELLLPPAPQHCQPTARAAVAAGAADGDAAAAAAAAAAADQAVQTATDSSLVLRPAAGDPRTVLQQVSTSDEWGSAVGRAAVFAGLGYYFLSVA